MSDNEVLDQISRNTGRRTMSDAPNEYRLPQPHSPRSTAPESASQPMAAPYLEFDIARELEQLHRQAGWQSGQNAKTLVKYRRSADCADRLEGAFENSRASHRGADLDPDVAGHIQVRAQGRSFHLPAGGLLALGQGLPHDVEALEESAFLLTIAWPQREGQASPVNNSSKARNSDDAPVGAAPCGGAG